MTTSSDLPKLRQRADLPFGGRPLATSHILFTQGLRIETLAILFPCLLNAYETTPEGPIFDEIESLVKAVRLESTRRGLGR
jgi:hypothetical protein